MNIHHIKITFEDAFSFAKIVKETTVSDITLQKMRAQIGEIVHRYFDKSQGIQYTLRLVSIEPCEPKEPFINKPIE